VTGWCCLTFTYKQFSSCCSPEAVMQEVWRRPSAQALADLKECLDFGTSAWIGLFARLGGAELLLQVCTCRQESWMLSQPFKTTTGFAAVILQHAAACGVSQEIGFLNGGLHMTGASGAPGCRGDRGGWRTGVARCCAVSLGRLLDRSASQWAHAGALHIHRSIRMLRTLQAMLE
jgi:hypothetical protein